MKMKLHTFLFNLIAVVILTVTMVVSPASAGNLLASTPQQVGYSDFSYGTAVKAEPTAEVPESKLWWNDGRWWGVLFDPATSMYTIYWFDWGNKTWVKTATTLDSRIDDTGEVAVRFDALWDDVDDKLYLASHIKQDNPSEVNSADNFGRLYRYTYQTSSKTYQLDTGFPTTVNFDKTKTMTLDKDSSGRLWVTYVSHPTGNLTYKVFVNYTNTAGLSGDSDWHDSPIDLSTISLSGAVVTMDDISSVITFTDAGGPKVGVMWSNEQPLEDSFYWAETPVDSSPETNWSVTKLTFPGLTANDHIKLVNDSDGTVYAVIKTDKDLTVDPGTDPLIGVLTRNRSNGAFSFQMISDASSLDTRPTIVLDESNDLLHVFASSNEAGGIICKNTIDLSTDVLTGGNCSSGSGSAAAHFIASDTYDEIDNATTTKQNINNNTGLVVLATDDVNGSVYLHNTLGSPLATITSHTPVSGGTLNAMQLRVTVTFSEPIDPTTLTSSSFMVTESGGEVDGTIFYDAGSRTAIFTGTDDPVDGATYEVTITTGIEDALGRPLYEGKSWEFVMNVVELSFIYLPMVSR